MISCQPSRHGRRPASGDIVFPPSCRPRSTRPLQRLLDRAHLCLRARYLLDPTEHDRVTDAEPVRIVGQDTQTYLWDP